MPDNKQKNQINIELGEEQAEGTYANLAMITHSHAEFIIDFIKMMPGMPKAKVKSRVILTPQHAKRLLRALKENISKYESMHGTIEAPEGPEGLPPFHLGGPTAQA
ncbi:MAG: DUF3467 domain-containing protein [Bacteroidales bacterium]|jgi:hypothetical protein